ncbi:dnaJ-like protein MG200 homolog isoform X2 [Eurytemora carolleeae]|uniref:dnaJ-like protein MG200 homolog isoform X2 n=1 Tax=Eurytemora carolleeae TaxID=1294199 RepID=UPI000C75FAE2|nr:dnaJ-like protein MG200 homolog isoform X2 [Eurytemora carolleeae]|eukprot:XP_023334743.1 dnaJ-like protein MG200 homolog isoform X2 [Eurytemora affinis]
MTQIILVIISVLVYISNCSEHQKNLVDDEPLPDYYAILKVSHTASLKEIKKSFRKLAMQFHPDKNKDEVAQDIFKELSEAYSILSNEEKKSEYDELYKFDHLNHEDDMSEKTNDDFLPTRFDAKTEDPKTETPEPKPSANFFQKDDTWGDLDDETLFKVLKFLADNDYEITKKKIYKDIPVPEGTYQNRMFEEQSRSKRSSDSEYRNEEPLRYTGYNEYRSSGAEPRMSGVNYSRYTEPIHRYSRYSEPTPRYSRYSDPTTPDDRSYCRTTVSWDGATRVTQKSCF